MTWFRLTKNAAWFGLFASTRSKKHHLVLVCGVFLSVLTVLNFRPILLELQEFPAWMKCQVLLCGDYADLAGIQVPCISTLTVWKDWHDHVINYTMVFNKIFRPVKEICTCTDNSPKWPHHVFPIRFLTDSEDSHVRSSNLFFLVGRLGSYSEKSYVKGSIFGGLFGFPKNCVIICFPGSYCHAMALISQIESPWPFAECLPSCWG